MASGKHRSPVFFLFVRVVTDWFNLQVHFLLLFIPEVIYFGPQVNDKQLQLGIVVMDEDQHLRSLGVQLLPGLGDNVALFRKDSFGAGRGNLDFNCRFCKEVSIPGLSNIP